MRRKGKREFCHERGGPGRLLPRALRLVDGSSLSKMAPSDILLLEEVGSMRDSIEPIFIAVLACPVCGLPSLITAAQYSGAAPVMCGSKDCSGLFRIVDERRLDYLPVN